MLFAGAIAINGQLRSHSEEFGFTKYFNFGKYNKFRDVDKIVFNHCGYAMLGFRRVRLAVKMIDVTNFSS